MPGDEFDPERLRPAEYLHEPDPRNALTAWCDTTTGFTRQLQAKDLHDAVAGFALDPAVPEDIAQHFETVKNLFLYSWFVYRFQPVAELQSLACLEYALRNRLENEIQTGKFNEKRPGLQKLLRYAIDNQLVKNEGFDRWVRSRDPEWDLLASLEKALPRIRNDYAHGTYNLAPTALGIIELVHEIINQLFPPSATKESG
jgi:hypothetical protein